MCMRMMMRCHPVKWAVKWAVGCAFSASPLAIRTIFVSDIMYCHEKPTELACDVLNTTNGY